MHSLSVWVDKTMAVKNIKRGTDLQDFPKLETNSA